MNDIPSHGARAPYTLFFSLVSHAALRLGRNDPQRWLRVTLKFWGGALASPRSTLQWLQGLRHPDLQRYVQHQPRLLDKPLRPYLNKRWNTAQRVGALLSHYRWIARRMQPAVLEALYAHRPLKLCEFALKGAPHTASVWLTHACHQTREGELALVLCAGHADAAHSVDGLPPVLATLSFSIVDDGGAHHLSIGCVQGAASAGLSDFKQLTKAMHGLRPKALLVRVAQICSVTWQLGLRGIEPGVHPFTSWRYRLSPIKHAAVTQILTGYGALWRESGGAAAGSGDWVTLPGPAPIKSRDEVEVSKRSLYERRGVLLRDMQAQMEASLQGLHRPSDAARANGTQRP